MYLLQEAGKLELGFPNHEFIQLWIGPQYAERILNKTAKAMNETLSGLKLLLQGFRIYFFEILDLWPPEKTEIL